MRLSSTLLIPALMLMLSSCNYFGGGDEDVPYYVTYKISGEIKDNDGKPVQGVAVNITAPAGHTLVGNVSDAEGKYAIEQRKVELYLGNIEVEAQEKQAAKITYQAQAQNVSFAKDEYKGGDRHWYLGHAEKTLNFTLQEKTSTPDPDPDDDEEEEEGGEEKTE